MAASRLINFVYSQLKFFAFLWFLAFGSFASAVLLAWVFIKNNFLTASQANLDNESNKLVIITGADSGFGRLTAELLFTSTKYQILALTLTEAAAVDLSAIGKHDNNTNQRGRLQGLKCDVTKDSDVVGMENFVSKLLQENENMFVYALINNAGVSCNGAFPWFNDISDYERVMNINYLGTVRVTKAVVSFMLKKESMKRKDRRIINISSVGGIVGFGAVSTYSASKFAVEGLSDSLRIELEPFGIYVTRVRPSGFKTNIFDSGLNEMSNSFEKAPKDIQDIYGGEKYKKKLQETTSQLSGLYEDPSIVAEKLKDILIAKHPPKCVYWVGWMSEIIFKALDILPKEFADLVQGAGQTRPILED